MKAILIFLLGAIFAGISTAEDRKPNILFLFSDDQSFETIRALGHTDIDTPNLDRLVSAGTTFTHAYNMGSWSPAVCIASRSMLITGRSLWQANAIYAKTDAERAAGRLWPQMLAAAGYDTYFTGKWHINTDAAKTFDTVGHVRGGMPKDTPQGYNRPLADAEDPWNPADPAFGGFWAGGTHWSEVTADDAIGYLGRANARENKPFFMYVAFNAPHDPRQSPQEFVDRYPLDRIELPQSFLASYPYKEAIGAGTELRDEKLGPFPRTEQAVKVNRREYYALITHLDAQIGRILDALEASGEAENTWIFFTSDHGLAVGHHGLFGKQNLYDHSLRVPFIAVGPGVAKNAKIAAPILLQDVMATTLDLARIEKPAHVAFHSLLPLLRGAKDTPAGRESIYAAYLNLQRAIIHDGWKLIVYPKARIVRLYDLTADPLEMNDLAPDEDFSQRVSDLFASLLAMQEELEDKLDLRAAFPDL